METELPNRSNWTDSKGVTWSKQHQASQLTAPQFKRCWAQLRGKPGRRCRKAPLAGQRVCELHGGKTPNSLAMATQRNQIVEAQRALAQLGIPIPPTERIDPREVLLDAVQKAYSIKQALEFLLTEFTEEEVASIGRVQEHQLGGESGYIQQRPDPRSTMIRQRLELYNEALERAAKIANLALRAGVEERMVRLAERQSELIVQIIRASVAHLPMEMQLIVMENAATEMRVLSAKPVMAAARPQLAATMAEEAVPEPNEPTNGAAPTSEAP